MIVSSRRTLLPRKAQKVMSVWWLLIVFAGLWLASIAFKFGIIILSWLSLIIFLGFGLWLFERRRLRKIAEKRQTDSICSFARSFDCHKIDTKIIRAVYEELQRYYYGDVPSFPIRATDSFETDLKLDPEDLNDISREIAARAQRSMNGCEQNPLYGNVKTVTDLVLFFTHQPFLQKV
jgi:hypothetical protein